MRTLILITTFSLSSCININQIQKIYTAEDPIEFESSEEAVVICDSREVLKLANYKLPSIPDIDTVPIGDRKGEVQLLLDHINTLRAELRRVAKDYGCKPA